DEANVEIEQAAGFDRRAELRLVDSHEIDQLSAASELQRFNRQDRRRLRQRLNLQHTRHDRATRKMPLEELLVETDRLNRVDFLVDLQALDPIDEKQRIAVRQRVENL